MKACEEEEVYLQTSSLNVDECSASHPSHFNFGERASGTYWIKSWVGPGVGLDIFFFFLRSFKFDLGLPCDSCPF
jgi:hypothetical protein